MKTFKVREITAAIRKNGYPKIQGSYFSREAADIHTRLADRKVLGACAVGQASLNLNVSASNLDAGLRGITATDSMCKSLASRIIRLNDYTDWDMAQIADIVEAEYKDQLDTVVTVYE